MAVVRGIGRFLYDFVIGDDGRIAAGVAASLGLALILLYAHAPPAAVAIGTAALIAATFVFSVLRRS